MPAFDYFPSIWLSRHLPGMRGDISSARSSLRARWYIRRKGRGHPVNIGMPEIQNLLSCLANEGVPSKSSDLEGHKAEAP